MVRPTKTASLLSFHRIREQASALCHVLNAVAMTAKALNAASRFVVLFVLFAFILFSFHSRIVFL